MAAGVFRGAQSDAHSVRRWVSRGSGCRGRALGGMGSAGNTILRSRDGIPMASVSKRHPTFLCMRTLTCSFPRRPRPAGMCMERVWCVPSCSRPGKAKSRCWTSTCTRRARRRWGRSSLRRVWASTLSSCPRVHASFASHACFPRTWCSPTKSSRRCLITPCQLRDSTSCTSAT